jgi:fructose-1,6-bisphosphatase/inositol monophosphatase family enzyme
MFAGQDPWDMAVLDLLVSEAGGVVTDLHGDVLDFRKPIKGGVAGSKESHKRLMELIHG